MVEEHPELLDLISQMGVVGHCRFQGDFCRNEVGEDRKKVGQREGLGRLVLEDHSHCKDHGRGVLTHLGEEGYGCMHLEEHIVVPVDRSNLGNKKVLIISSTTAATFQSNTDNDS